MHLISKALIFEYLGWKNMRLSIVGWSV